MRTLSLLCCLPLAVAPFWLGDKQPDKGAPAVAPLAPANVLGPIEGIVKQLAKGAREREVKDLLSALDKLGYPKPAYDKLEKSAKDDLARAKTPLDSLPAGAKQLRVTATQLAALMDKVADEAIKKDMARQILKLDGECAAAHTALGHEKVGKSWVRSEFKDMRKRRGDIMQKVAEAKRLEVEMTTEENFDDEFIQQYCGVKATVVRRGAFEYRSNFSVEKTQRIMREVMRATALGAWVRRDEFKLPAAGPAIRQVTLLIDSVEMYMKLVNDMIKAGRIDPEITKFFATPESRLNSFDIVDGPRVRLAQWEADVTCALMVSASKQSQGILTPLTAGHLNWLALTCLGTTIPNYLSKDGGKGYGDTKVAGDDREREELLRLANSGIAGSRAWMQYLAERGEDPLFGNSLVNSWGDIQGNDLHKCTSIVEFFQEQEPKQLQKLFSKLSSAQDGGSVKIYTDAMGMPFGELESKWRDWLLGSMPGVAERIDKQNLNAYPPEGIAVQNYLNQIRAAAFKDRIEGSFDIKFDPDLSDQCASHAHYLTLHPEQQKWPDAHEEYADKEGYSVEGAWAGGHSVIMFGELDDFKGAVDGFLGTFYHRIPIIDPGVLRVGWGSAENVAVIDMGSLAIPYRKVHVIVYPYDKQTDVPCAFQGNEFPDPVPDGPAGSVIEGEKFGFPITISTNPVNERGEVVDLVMKLFEGSDGSKEVDCHFSSPSKPSNPELSPSGIWCLIPKTFLKSKIEYKVTADWVNSNKKTTSTAQRMAWTFKTE